MDATIPTLIGQWAMETIGNILNWPGPFGWGIITAALVPPTMRWSIKLPGIRKRTR